MNSLGGVPYQYQGVEKDPETNLLNFELRQFDARLGRWYNPDPMGEFHSPYLAMGNNPVSVTDPTGGYTSDQFWNSSDAPQIGAYAGLNFGVEDTRDGAQINEQPVADPSKNSYMFMTPAERRNVLAMNGTSYEQQAAQRILGLASVGGYKAKDGSIYTLMDGKLSRTSTIYGSQNPRTLDENSVIGYTTTPIGTVKDNSFISGFSNGYGDYFQKLYEKVSHPIDAASKLFTSEGAKSLLVNMAFPSLATSSSATDAGIKMSQGDYYGAGYTTGGFAGETTLTFATEGLGYGLNGLSGVAGRLLYKAPVIGANSRLFGAGIKFKKMDFSTKGILNNNNFARLGWQMTTGQTLRFGLRFGANPKYLNIGWKLGIEINNAVYNSFLGHGFGSIMKVKLP